MSTFRGGGGTLHVPQIIITKTLYLPFYVFVRKSNNLDKKLTLSSLDQTIIESAKGYAKSNNVSLSRLIESYLNSLTKKSDKEKSKITPLVESLSGVVTLPKDFDEKEAYAEYLMKKYK